MTLGHASVAVLILTTFWVVAILLERAFMCKHWRKPENNRRKAAEPYEGPDRRRCTRCPHQDCAPCNRDLGICEYAEPK